MLAFVPRAAGRATVMTIQGLDWQRDKWGSFARRAFSFGARSTAGVPGAVITVSKHLQRHYQDAFGREAHYVPNGVRTPEFVPPGDTLAEFGLEAGKYILFVARLVPEKGLHYLLRAYENLGSELPLVVVGSGSGSYMGGYEEELRAQARGNVVFTGFQSGTRLGELFSNARCYVLPSTLEGLPISLLEAMSYGLPVIHSAIPECLEVTEDGSGLSFVPRDPISLASVLREVVRDDKLAQELSTAGRLRVASHYNWESIAESTEQIYSAVFERTGAKSA
jgi:glycosyltransferase involved in cell wall biosynthesis